MIPLTSLFASWVVVTLLLIVLLIVRRRMVSREQDWISFNAPVTVIANQQRIEHYLRYLNAAVHCIEAADVVLLLTLAAVWIQQGLNTVRI